MQSEPPGPDRGGSVAAPGISVAEAARRLGVKQQTVYAYVSRGLLTSWRVPGRRESRLDPVEVQRLAARQHGARGRAGRLEVVVDSNLTLLEAEGRLAYRGFDAVEASRTALFEQVAMWLWGRPAAAVQGSEASFTAPPELLGPARAAAELAGPGASPLDRYVLALAAASAADHYRHSRLEHGLANRAARMIATLVESLPPAAPTSGSKAGGRPGGMPTVAERLWERLTPLPAEEGQVGVLNAALVLLADHELAASTLAARVAASTWADIYKVVTAGMAALGGPLHGGAGDRAAALVREALAAGVDVAVGSRLAAEEPLPGIGHAVYLERDPRADALFAAIAAAWPGHEALTVAAGVLEAVREERPEAFANVDLALGTLIAVAGMIDGAAEAIFATARTAGWVAHGIEEYQHRLRFRPRAAYTGPEPGSAAPVLGEHPPIGGSGAGGSGSRRASARAAE
ncbi:MAG TPA: citrate synthase [Acidimicrobiales bacterium]|nr:citrate synthase [Acidimicrobiales bacterium]